MTSFAGVDVGLDGGLAVIAGVGAALSYGGHVAVTVDLTPMPTLSVKTRTKTKREINTSELASWLRALNPDTFVLVEKPQLRPAFYRDDRGDLHVNQGVQSQANFLAQGRLIEGMLVALMIPHEFVHPATWKADVFRGQAARDKDAARQKAMQLFPQLADRFKNRNSHGLAEALLLADYCRRRRTGNVG